LTLRQVGQTLPDDAHAAAVLGAEAEKAAKLSRFRNSKMM